MTFQIIARCTATARCKGMLGFGVMSVESHLVAERLREVNPQTATCPICLKDEGYTSQNFVAVLQNDGFEPTARPAQRVEASSEGDESSNPVKSQGT